MGIIADDISKNGIKDFYGISKPGEQRLEQIREALHFFGRELQGA